MSGQDARGACIREPVYGKGKHEHPVAYRENRPYVVLTYEDVEPEVDHCAPKSGFVNEKADNVFRWRFWANQTAVAQPVQQAAYQFRWRVTGQSAYQESTVASGEGSHTVPAGTFPENGSIDWCVRGQSDDGVWSDWSDWMTLTTQDSLSKPSGLRPDLGYVDGNLPQPFPGACDFHRHAAERI